MATIQNPFRGINTSLGTSKRESTGEALAGLVSESLQTYAKVKEIDKKFDAEQDAKLSETEMIAYNDKMSQLRQQDLENDASGMNAKDYADYKRKQQQSLGEFVNGFGSSWAKTKSTKLVSVFDKDIEAADLTYQKELKTEAIPQLIGGLLDNPNATAEDKDNVFKALSSFRTGEEYKMENYIKDMSDLTIDKLSLIKTKIESGNYNQQDLTVAKELANNSYDYIKNPEYRGKIKNALNVVNETHQNKYDEKFKENTYSLLYNENGVYDTKSLRSLQKSLKNNDNLSTPTKTAIFQRVESIFSYLQSKTEASNKSIGINAIIDISNTLDKQIDTTATNGENISNDLLQNLKERVLAVTPYATPAKANELHNKIETIEFNIKSREYVNELVKGIQSGDNTIIAEYQKAKDSGTQIDLGNGNTKNVSSSFITSEISKQMKALDNKIINEYGYEEVKDEKGNVSKVFNDTKFQAEVYANINLKNKLEVKSEFIDGTTSKVLTNSALSANNPEDYYKLLLTDMINKQDKNQWEDSDRYRMARIKPIYEEYKSSTDKNKDDIFLNKMLSAKNEAFQLNQGRKYQASLRKNILDAKDYVENRSGIGMPLSNSIIEDRSLYAYQSWINNKGKMIEDADEVKKHMNSNYLTLESKVFSAPNGFFKPDNVDEEYVKAAIDNILENDGFGVKVKMDELKIYNQNGIDGNIDIVLEREDSNGMQTIVLNANRIKELGKEQTLKKKKVESIYTDNGKKKRDSQFGIGEQ